MRVAQMYKGGATQTQIAKSLNVSVATVNADIQAIKRSWRKTQETSIAEAAMLDLERINDLLVALTIAARSGDTAAIREYRALLERRAAILGYDAPKRTDTHLSGYVGTPVEELILAARESRMKRLGAEADRVLAETSTPPALIECPEPVAEQATPPFTPDRQDEQESIEARATRLHEAARQDRRSGPLHY